jgi:stringent starvation protein B
MSNSTHPLPRKKDVAMALLQGPSIFIHLDPRKPEVVVPAYFKKQPQLVLQVGLNMAIAIPDLKVDDEGVTCTLSFNRRPFWCRLPWTAIYALVGEALEGEDMKGMLWPDDVPAEIAAQRDGKSPQVGAQGPQRTRPQREAKKKVLGAAGPPSEPKRAVPPKAVERAPEAEGSTMSSAASAAMSQPKRDGSKSGKRELPPYLRVVK